MCSKIKAKTPSNHNCTQLHCQGNHNHDYNHNYNVLVQISVALGFVSGACAVNVF